MSRQAKILLVEDEENFGSVLTRLLTMDEFDVHWVKSGALALSVIRSDREYDCCVLDVMLPHIDGLTLGVELKKYRAGLPFIYLTARSMKEDVIKGFNTGADDYITKPFDSEILVLKLRALIQRADANHLPQDCFSIGLFVFEVPVRSLEGFGTVRRLSPKETELLRVLAENMNRVVQREELLQRIWGEDSYFTRRSMDVYIAKLRKILSPDSRIEIISLHGGGYQLRVAEAP